MNEVDQWFIDKARPLDALMRQVRAVVLGADSRVTESIESTSPACFSIAAPTYPATTRASKATES